MRLRRLALGLGTLLLAGAPSRAYETDQFTARTVAIADSTEVLNAEVNRILIEIAGQWRGGPNRRLFARRVYARLGGRYWVDRLERWANRSPRVEKLPQRRRGSIYSGLPWWATRFAGVFGTGPTIRVAGALIGTDKLGHFLSQGWKYHRRHLRGLDEARVLSLGVRNEASIFGASTTGSFSNADLVANYEGYRFYRSLFEDDIVPGKPAIVEWLPGGGARIRRPFDFRDHVNDFWDEALNPNRYDRLLRGAMQRRLEGLCDEYRAAPAAFSSPDEASLRRRYDHLGMRDGTESRLDQLCAGAPDDGVEAGH